MYMSSFSAGDRPTKDSMPCDLTDRRFLGRVSTLLQSLDSNLNHLGAHRSQSAIYHRTVTEQYHC